MLMMELSPQVSRAEAKYGSRWSVEVKTVTRLKHTMAGSAVCVLFRWYERVALSYFMIVQYEKFTVSGIYYFVCSSPARVVADIIIVAIVVVASFFIVLLASFFFIFSLKSFIPSNLTNFGLIFEKIEVPLLSPTFNCQLRAEVPYWVHRLGTLHVHRVLVTTTCAR